MKFSYSAVIAPPAGSGGWGFGVVVGGVVVLVVGGVGGV